MMRATMAFCTGTPRVVPMTPRWWRWFVTMRMMASCVHITRETSSHGANGRTFAWRFSKNPAKKCTGASTFNSTTQIKCLDRNSRSKKQTNYQQNKSFHLNLLSGFTIPPDEGYLHFSNYPMKRRISIKYINFEEQTSLILRFIGKIDLKRTKNGTTLTLYYTLNNAFCQTCKLIDLIARLSIKKGGALRRLGLKSVWKFIFFGFIGSCNNPPAFFAKIFNLTIQFSFPE
jgi:hypothetical protein